MIKIVDTYTLISFEYDKDPFKFQGTCNLKLDNTISTVNATITRQDANVGNITKSGKSTNITIYDDEDLPNVSFFVETLPEIINSLTEYLKNDPK